MKGVESCFIEKTLGLMDLSVSPVEYQSHRRHYFTKTLTNFSVFLFLFDINIDLEEVVDILNDAPEPVPQEQPNLFADLDTNKDGKLSEAEVEVYFTKLGQPGIPDGLWEREDADKDGFISWEEFSGPKGNEAPEL